MSPTGHWDEVERASNLYVVPHMLLMAERQEERVNNGHKLNAQRGFIRDHRLL